MSQLGVTQSLPEDILDGGSGGSQAKLSPACSAHDVGRLAHRLRSAAQRHVGPTKKDLLGSLDDRLQP